MKKYNISTNLIQVIKNLNNEATSAVLFNSSIGDWFPTTDGVRQGCLLSPTLFNIFLERIMTDALEDHEGTVSIGGRTIIKLRFADDMVWSCFPFIRSGKNHLAKHSERGEEDKADTGRGGKTPSGNGQAWSLASLRGQWRTGKNRGNFGAPTTLAVKG